MEEETWGRRTTSQSRDDERTRRAHLTRRTIKLVCNGPNLPSSHTGPFTSGFFVQGLLVRRPLRFNRQQIVLALAIGRDGNEIANGRTPPHDSFSFSFLFFHALLYSIHPLVSIPRLFFKEIKQATIDRFISREGEKTLDFLQDGNSLSSPLLSCQVFGRKMGRGRIGPNRSYQVQVSRSKGGG